MTSLRSVLAFNMKAQRHKLGITQATLAEKVDTSTHYIGMIESEKKFPTPEMLERIAAALEIDSPVLFSTKTYPSTGGGTMAEFQEQVLHDISEVIAYRIKKLEQKASQPSFTSQQAESLPKQPRGISQQAEPLPHQTRGISQQAEPLPHQTRGISQQAEPLPQ